MLPSLVLFIALLMNKHNQITFMGSWRIQYHQPLLQQQHSSQRSGNLICTISPSNYTQFKQFSKQKQTKIRVSNIFKKSEDSFLQELHHSPNISISQIYINDDETKIQKMKIQPSQLYFQITQNRQVIISHSQFRWVFDKFIMKHRIQKSEANIPQYLVEYIYIGLVVIAYIGYKKFQRQDYAYRVQIVTTIFWILANYYVQSKDDRFLYLMYANFGVNLFYFIRKVGKEQKKSGIWKWEIVNILVILCLFIFMSFSFINVEVIYLLYFAYEIQEVYFIIRDSKNAAEINNINTHSQSFDLHIQFLLVGYQIYNYLYLQNLSKVMIFVIGSFCIQLLKNHIRKIGANKIVEVIKSRYQKQKKDENDLEQKPLL